MSMRNDIRSNGPAPVIEQVEAGTAELIPDPQRPGGWTLYVDDAGQSYVDLSQPTYLEFGYVRRIASIIGAAAPAAAPLRVLHLGAGALTLPRYIAATRPGSPQLVIEYDRKLLSLVRRALPLATCDLEFRIADATTEITGLQAGGFDMVIADMFQGHQTPAAATTAGFATEVARVLRPGALYAANILDAPPFTATRVQAAIARTTFADVCLISDPGINRQGGLHNIILAAATAPGRLPLQALAHSLNQTARSQIVHGPSLDRSIGTAHLPAAAHP